MTKSFASLPLAIVAGLSLLTKNVSGDIVFENELIKPEEIYDLVVALDSNVSAYTMNDTNYYCVFRSNWNKKNHPADYPDLARYGEQAIFSHTKQYTPYLKNREAPMGVEKVAEVGTCVMPL